MPIKECPNCGQFVVIDDSNVCKNCGYDFSLGATKTKNVVVKEENSDDIILEKDSEGADAFRKEVEENQSDTDDSLQNIDIVCKREKAPLLMPIIFVIIGAILTLRCVGYIFAFFLGRWRLDASLLLTILTISFYLTLTIVMFSLGIPMLNRFIKNNKNTRNIIEYSNALNNLKVYDLDSKEYSIPIEQLNEYKRNWYGMIKLSFVDYNSNKNNKLVTGYVSKTGYADFVNNIKKIKESM